MPSRFGFMVYPAAATYFSAAGITDPTEQAAVTTLIAGLMADGTWDLMDRVHPISPTSLNAASYCCKTLKKLTWVNSPTHSSSGVAFNGTNQYGLTDLVVTAYPLFTSTLFPHVSSYIQAIGALSGTQYIFGASGLDSGDNPTLIALRQATTSIVSVIRGTSGVNQTASLNASHHTVVRQVGALKRYRNGTQVATTAVAPLSSDNPGVKMAIGAVWNGAAASSFMPYTCAFFNFGASLSAAQELTVYNRIQTYQTSLGRNV